MQKPFYMEQITLGCWNIWTTRNATIFKRIRPSELDLLLHRATQKSYANSSPEQTILLTEKKLSQFLDVANVSLCKDVVYSTGIIHPQVIANNKVHYTQRMQSILKKFTAKIIILEQKDISNSKILIVRTTPILFGFLNQSALQKLLLLGVLPDEILCLHNNKQQIGLSHICVRSFNKLIKQNYCLSVSRNQTKSIIFQPPHQTGTIAWTGEWILF